MIVLIPFDLSTIDSNVDVVGGGGGVDLIGELVAVGRCYLGDSGPAR
jgi:hypothetical protein